MTQEYLVTQCLPNDGQKVLCYGHKTYCCVQDMEDECAWHEVVFKFTISTYRLKKEVPVDPEETILEEITFVECWDLFPTNQGYGHVIGVSKWKQLDK